MTDTKQILLDNAQVKFLSGDIAGFSATIKDLYDSHITCNCFLRSQPREVWESLAIKAKTFKDIKNDFDLNFAKGFIFLQNKNEQEALKYLTIAIQINSSSDICYYLRASIENTINNSNLDDAKEAVILNPNARNYFRLANSYADKESKKTITYFQKAILLNNKFACAYNNMALQYKSLKDYKNAAHAFLKCISIEKNHWCYYELWHCLDEIKDYKQAFEIATEGYKLYPKELKYLFALGVANSRLGNYTDAINFYETYLKYYPTEPVTLKNLKSLVSECARNSFQQNNFFDSVKNFEKLISLNEELSFYDQLTYLKSLLKYHNSDLIIDDKNSHFIKLNSTYNSYKENLKNRKPISEEEKNVSNLKGYLINTKINFGKYFGSTIEEILNVDTHYILWCIINLSHFSIYPKILFEQRLKNDKDYFKALEINIIKLELIDLWDEIEDLENTMHERYLHEDSSYPSYNEWLQDEFGDEAGTAFWNLD